MPLQMDLIYGNAAVLMEYAFPRGLSPYEISPPLLQAAPLDRRPFLLSP